MITKMKSVKKRKKVISISLLFFILFGLVDLSLSCDLIEESCCCSIEISAEESVDSCCEIGSVPNCSLENSSCGCSNDFHNAIYSLPSPNHSEFEDSILEFDSFYNELPDFFGGTFRYFSRGSPNYSQPESSVSLFVTLHWSTIRFLC